MLVQVYDRTLPDPLRKAEPGYSRSIFIEFNAPPSRDASMFVNEYPARASSCSHAFMSLIRPRGSRERGEARSTLKKKGVRGKHR
jgi:hypothetical protein